MEFTPQISWMLVITALFSLLIGMAIRVTIDVHMNKHKEDRDVIHIVVKNNQGQRYEGDIEEV